MAKISALCAGFIAFVALASTASADPVGGTKVAKDRIYPDQVIAYDLAFRAAEITRVRVQGDGDGDIDCWLFDNNGNVVASDTDSTDTCVLAVTPKWTGLFRLKLQNRGDTYSNFAMVAD